MTTRLASERITISLDGHSVELTPSLRAALRLARRYSTYGELIGKIMEGDTQAIADTIGEGADFPTALPVIMTDIEARGILSVVSLLKNPLIAFVMSLAGPTPKDDGKAQAKPTGKAMTFDAFHEQLFQIATGMLGWTPAEAWAATPAEIIAARDGRIQMLRMIFGSGDDGENSTLHENLSLDDQALAVFGGRRRKAA